MNTLTKEEFLEKLKTDRDFNNKYGRKHITGGKQVLPPCHYGFQVYTREMSVQERKKYDCHFDDLIGEYPEHHITLDKRGVPHRAISLMWNQRSVDTFLGLPFNIASYGLLLEIIAKEVNMIPEELIGNLGDTHLYSNHIEQAKIQIGEKLSLDERVSFWFNDRKPNRDIVDAFDTLSTEKQIAFLDARNIPETDRHSFDLPKLEINTEFWQTESGECGVGLFKTDLRGLKIDDFKLVSYQSHPGIKAPLSN